MSPLVLRAILLGGLLLHKVVWEVMKRREEHWREIQPEGRAARPELLGFLKASFLVAIVVQTLLPGSWATLGLPIAAGVGTLHVVGLGVFGAGLLIALLGRAQLGHNWSDIERAGVHSSQRVVTHGLYRLIRHPIYTGDILLLIGLELALNSWIVLLIAVLAPIVARQAMREEAMLARTLDGYAEYCTQTKRFVPFVF